MLKGHIRLRSETDASTEDVAHGRTLLVERVDDRGTLGNKRSLQHVRKDAEDGVEALVLLGRLAVGRVRLPGHASHELGSERKIHNERGRQEGIFADVGHGDALVTTHEDLAVVLIHSALVIANSGHVLDDDGVVGVLVLGVEDVVGSNHVVDNVGLGDLLGAELLGSVEVEAVVVAEEVEGSNGGELDTGVDKEVNKRGLHLGLTGLEVVTADEGVVALSELEAARNEGVLGGAVDEGDTLEDGGHGEDGGGGNFLVRGLDGLEEVVGGVVDTGDDLGETLGVGGPEDDHLVKGVGLLEAADVTTDLLEVLALAAGEEVVGTVSLVGGNEVGVVDGGKRLEVLHLGAELALEIGLKNGGTIHGIGQVHVVDVPTTEDEVVGVGHGEKVMERNVDLLTSLGVGAELDGGGHDDGAIVVRLLLTLARVPGDVVAVGNDTGGDSGTVVTTPSNQHQTDLSDLTLHLEVILGLQGLGDVLAVVLGDLGGAVGVLGLDLILGVGHVGGVDHEKVVGAGGRGRCSIAVGFSVCVRCHF